MGAVGFPGNLLSVGLCDSSRCGSSEVDGSSTTTAEPTPVISSPVVVISGRPAVVVVIVAAVVAVAAVAAVVDGVVVTFSLLGTYTGDARTGEVKWSTILDTCVPIITRVALISGCGFSALLGFSVVLGLSVVVDISVVDSGNAAVDDDDDDDGAVNFSVTFSTGFRLGTAAVWPPL